MDWVDFGLVDFGGWILGWVDFRWVDFGGWISSGWISAGGFQVSALDGDYFKNLFILFKIKKDYKKFQAINDYVWP